MTSFLALALACREENGERGRVEEGDRAQVDDDAAQFLALTAVRGDGAASPSPPTAVPVELDRLCQRLSIAGAW